MWTSTSSLSRTNKYSEQCPIVLSRHNEYGVPIADEKNEVMFKKNSPRTTSCVHKESFYFIFVILRVLISCGKFDVILIVHRR